MSESVKKAIEFMEASGDSMTGEQLAFITGYATCAAMKDQKAEEEETQKEDTKE